MGGGPEKSIRVGPAARWASPTGGAAVYAGGASSGIADSNGFAADEVDVEAGAAVAVDSENGFEGADWG
jgi:hypothetical protein